jgi:beta-lactam-binding protein with PASTA domain
VPSGRGLPAPPDEEADFAFVPDFAGRTIVGALHLAERESLEITPVGAVEGRVVSQFPVPGTVLEAGKRTVRLRFELPPDAARRVAQRREEG